MAQPSDRIICGLFGGFQKHILYVLFFFLAWNQVAVAYLFPKKTLAWHHLGWMSVLIKKWFGSSIRGLNWARQDRTFPRFDGLDPLFEYMCGGTATGFVYTFQQYLSNNVNQLCSQTVIARIVVRCVGQACKPPLVLRLSLPVTGCWRCSSHFFLWSSTLKCPRM
jgi:hypothetical protein